MSNQDVSIMIVDDEPVNLLVLRSMLEKESYSVVECSSGPDCLNQVKQQAPMMILLDIMMPGMSGYETAKKIQEDPNTKNIPILFVSAVSIEEQEQNSEGLHISGFIRKPIRLQEILNQVATQLDAASGSSSSSA